MGGQYKQLVPEAITPAGRGIKKRIKQNKTTEVVFSVLARLEKNGMDKIKTAEDLGLSRATIYRYWHDHWWDYEKKKKMDQIEREEMDSIHSLVSTAQKTITAENGYEVLTAVVSIRERIKDSFYASIKEFDRRIHDPVERKKMSSRDIAQHINNIIPYLLAKEVGNKEDGEQDKVDDFMNNFVELMSQFNDKQKQQK